MDKKKIGIGTGAAAAVTAAVIAATPNYKTINGTYKIETVSPYKAEIHMTVPDSFSPDIVTLELNGAEITKTLLPGGTISTYPVVVSDVSRLSAEMYVRGENAATAEFKPDVQLEITVEEKYVKEAAEDEAE